MNYLIGFHFKTLLISMFQFAKSFNILSDSTCIYEDFDYIGGDISTEKSSNSEECLLKCMALNDCKKWTYYTDELCEKCHLKKSNVAFNKEKCEGCITGFRNSSLQKCGIDGKINLISFLFRIVRTFLKPFD